MAFKYKPVKKHKSSPKLTLDKSYENNMSIFNHNDEVVIPELKKKCKELELNNQPTDELKLKIKILLDSKKNYLLKNSKHIFDYFENKKDISTNNIKPKLLDTFFGINKEQNKQVLTKHNETVTTYFKNVDPKSLNMDPYFYENDVCQDCDIGELIQIEYEGIMVCNNCYKNTPYVYQVDKPSYKEPPQEVCFYAYQRINHFREILAQFQAKETTQISDEFIEQIRLQVVKERIPINDLTNLNTKNILKKLGLNKYYEHIPFINDRLGIKPPTMNTELEDKLCSLFKEIQRPYSKYCPDNRTNFLNYNYTIYKLCEILGQHKFLSYFPMLKDREKRIEQDEIWKNICKDLNWQFIPTI